MNNYVHKPNLVNNSFPLIQKTVKNPFLANDIYPIIDVEIPFAPKEEPLMPINPIRTSDVFLSKDKIFEEGREILSKNEKK